MMMNNNIVPSFLLIIVVRVERANVRLIELVKLLQTGDVLQNGRVGEDLEKEGKQVLLRGGGRCAHLLDDGRRAGDAVLKGTVAGRQLFKAREETANLVGHNAQHRFGCCLATAIELVAEDLLS